MKKYSEYYIAHVNISKTWFIGGIFRNEDNLAFERTIDGQNELLEFFVTRDLEQTFLALMDDLKAGGYIISWEKKPNRYLDTSPEPLTLSEN